MVENVVKLVALIAGRHAHDVVVRIACWIKQPRVVVIALVSCCGDKENSGLLSSTDRLLECLRCVQTAIADDLHTFLEIA